MAAGSSLELKTMSELEGDDDGVRENSGGGDGSGSRRKVSVVKGSDMETVDDGESGHSLA